MAAQPEGTALTRPRRATPRAMSRDHDPKRQPMTEKPMKRTKADRDATGHLRGERLETGRNGETY
jgi:hypothetical protein